MTSKIEINKSGRQKDKTHSTVPSEQQLHKLYGDTMSVDKAVKMISLNTIVAVHVYIQI